MGGNLSSQKLRGVGKKKRKKEYNTHGSSLWI